MFGVASAFIALVGKEKSKRMKTADCAYYLSMLWTLGRLHTLPAMAT